MEILGLKNTITEEQVSMDGLKSRMERAEKDLVNLKIKQKLPILTERKQCGEERALRDLEKYSQDLMFVSSESQRKTEKALKHLIAEIPTNMTKYINLQT